MARDLREIYDAPEVLAAIAAADRKTLKAAMAGTTVRRGEQGRNAHEPDVIAPCSWWMELQDSATISPEAKLRQAERDLAMHWRRADGPSERRWTRPVAICHQRGARSAVACMRLADLVRCCGGEFPETKDQGYLPVRIEYEDFLKILRSA